MPRRAPHVGQSTVGPPALPLGQRRTSPRRGRCFVHPRVRAISLSLASLDLCVASSPKGVHVGANRVMLESSPSVQDPASPAPSKKEAADEPRSRASSVQPALHPCHRTDTRRRPRPDPVEEPASWRRWFPPWPQPPKELPLAHPPQPPRARRSLGLFGSKVAPALPEPEGPIRAAFALNPTRLVDRSPPLEP